MPAARASFKPSRTRNIWAAPSACWFSHDKPELTLTNFTRTLCGMAKKAAAQKGRADLRVSPTFLSSSLFRHAAKCAREICQRQFRLIVTEPTRGRRGPDVPG